MKMASNDSMSIMNQDELIAKDLPELIALLTEFKAKLTDVTPSIENLQHRVSSGELDTEDGISFLEVKFHLMLSYIINLVYVMLLKVDGKPINEAPAVERLTEIRTILEKVRPIDRKLKYQVDKLVKIASTGVTSGATNPLSFKPNPENMSAKVADDESSDEEGEKSGVYVPPKVSAVPYDDETLENRKRKYEERQKMKSLNSSLLKDLREEYSEAPEELKEGYKAFRGRKSRDKESEKERYEEDNLIRLNRGKNDKKTKGESDLKELTKFESFGFDSENEDGHEAYGKRNKKSKSFSKGKQKKFKMKGKKKGKFRK